MHLGYPDPNPHQYHLTPASPNCDLSDVILVGQVLHNGIKEIVMEIVDHFYQLSFQKYSGIIYTLTHMIYMYMKFWNFCFGQWTGIFEILAKTLL